MKDFDENGLPTKEFYFFLRYNKIFDKDKIEEMNEYDTEYFNEYKRLYSDFKEALLVDDNNKASAIYGAIMSMFGFNRHYCSVHGGPIIGPYFKIGAKIVSKEAYESYMIIQEMEKKHSIKNKENNNKKTSSKTLEKTKK